MELCNQGQDIAARAVGSPAQWRRSGRSRKELLAAARNEGNGKPDEPG